MTIKKKKAPLSRAEINEKYRRGMSVGLMKVIVVMSVVGMVVHWTLALSMYLEFSVGTMQFLAKHVGSGLDWYDAIKVCGWIFALLLVLRNVRGLYLRVFWIAAFIWFLLETVLVEDMGLVSEQVAQCLVATHWTLDLIAATLFLILNRKYGWED